MLQTQSTGAKVRLMRRSKESEARFNADKGPRVFVYFFLMKLMRPRAMCRLCLPSIFSQHPCLWTTVRTLHRLDLPALASRCVLSAYHLRHQFSQTPMYLSIPR